MKQSDRSDPSQVPGHGGECALMMCSGRTEHQILRTEDREDKSDMSCPVLSFDLIIFPMSIIFHTLVLLTNVTLPILTVPLRQFPQNLTIACITLSLLLFLSSFFLPIFTDAANA
ncbi:hypothetical protein BLNAU_11868 [Blattamonas nauphoetae]|uniref:Uncharacterized protein n=1 Tax=Blattamonas nauphoetae TaxID=2049346 RepID=A0ABQ9XLD7_9EUKA|nr:hypothetical protein BLNAU_11868 [Blattamonas nauphoetae]